MIFVVSQSFIWFPWMMESSFSAGNTERCTLKTGFMTHTRFLEGRHAGLTCGGSWVEDQGEGDKGSRRRVRVKSAPANTDDLGGVWHTWHIRHTAGDHCMHRCFHEIATSWWLACYIRSYNSTVWVTISAVKHDHWTKWRLWDYHYWQKSECFPHISDRSPTKYEYDV